MKIVPIFAPKLFAFHYKGELKNELGRLLDSWNNPVELSKFLLENKNDIGGISIDDLIDKIINDVEDIENTLKKFTSDNSKTLDSFFKPLNNQEFRQIILSKQKGPRNYLRIYALKIDTDCYVITGGGIKLANVHRMEDRPHLNSELKKLEKCRNFLQSKDVSDGDSFYELLSENL